MERQYCASVFVIDYDTKSILLMYNRKLSKWLQPGGHIEGFEVPWETAVREVYEETGIKIKLIGSSYDNSTVEPISVSHYKNKVGDMIDIQYLGIPLSKELNNFEGNDTKWISIENIDNEKYIDDEIKNKVKKLYKAYK